VAAPAGTRGAPGLAAGDLLAARYRLVEPCSAATPGTSPRLWLAHDEVLARPVAAKVLVAPGPGAAALTSPFLDAAAAAGAVDSPVLACVYDAAIEQRTQDGRVDVAYVIREWVDGTPLPDVLQREGPYSPAEAVALATALLEGLAVAHSSGLAHGRVHPGNVLLTRSGSVRLTDLAVAAALPDGRVAAERAGDPGPVEGDVRDAAAVLYALLTARWPDAATPQPSAGLPGAPALRERPKARGRLISPRQVRAGVPTALDAAVMRALDPAGRAEAPGLRTAEALLDVLDVLEGLVRADRPARTPSSRRTPAPGRRRGALRRHVGVLCAAALLVGVGGTAYTAGRSLGTLRAPAEQSAAAGPTASAAAGPAPSPVDLTGLSVRDFDPDGDGQERPGSVANAHDGDPSTAWETERYDSADFGGLKDGVGLLVDLGALTGVRQVALALTRDGVSAELRAADEPAGDASAYRVLARARADGERLTLVPPEGTSERYLLVWLTGLAPDDGRFSAGVTDLAVTG
jgi:hypothetical protein